MYKSFYGINFFQILYCFFIYSFLGWIYESLYVSIRKKEWVNRGFLNGPYIPIYGVGASLFIIIFNNEFTIALTNHLNVQNVFYLFLIGMISATVLEYITSLLMEKLFHAKWWDYSDYKLNLQGRISLRASLFWGILSVIMVIFIQPPLQKLIDQMYGKAGEVFGIFLCVIFFVDFVITVSVTLQLNHRLQALERLREELYEYAEGLKWYDLREEVKGKLSGGRVADYIHYLKSSLEKEYDRVIKKENRNRTIYKLPERKRVFAEIEERFMEFNKKYKLLIESKSHEYIYKRMIKAFPKINFHNKQGVFNDYKEKLKRKSVKKK